MSDHALRDMQADEKEVRRPNATPAPRLRDALPGPEGVGPAARVAAHFDEAHSYEHGAQMYAGLIRVMRIPHEAIE